MRRFAPTILINPDVPPITQTISNVKHERRTTIGKQRETYNYEVFKPNTWIVDLVQFKASRDVVIWYVFLVHANSRYLIIREGFPPYPDAIELPENPKSRVKSDRFMPIIDSLMNVLKIRYLIGDSEKAFWSRQMMKYYETHNVQPYPVNVKQVGHLQLAILDRLVRTIRDMGFNAGITTYTPNILKQLAVIYNNQHHSTLSRLLKTPTSPADVFHNKALERRLVAIMREINREKGSRAIANGSKVYLKIINNPRQHVHKNIFTVIRHMGKTYVIDDGNGELQAGRSYIKPVKQKRH